MIKASELRIGNWVNRTAGIMQVSGITEEGVHFLDGDIIAEKYIEPVSITPEILGKCGFVRTRLTNYEHMNEQWAAKVYDDGGVRIDFMRYGRIDSFICGIYKYLHQFQNLIFALTGEELNIQL